METKKPVLMKKTFFSKIEGCPTVIPVGIPGSLPFTHRYREDLSRPVNSHEIRTRIL
jgi:hypothetical protein